MVEGDPLRLMWAESCEQESCEQSITATLSAGHFSAVMCDMQVSDVSLNPITLCDTLLLSV